MSCEGYNGIKKAKHEWRLIGTGYSKDTIACDIVCPECGALKTVTIINNDKANEALKKIIDNGDKFKIPRSIYVGKEDLS